MVDAEIVQVQFYLDVISGWGGEAGRTALNKQLDAHAGTDTGRPEYRQPAQRGCLFHGTALQTGWPRASAVVNESGMVNSPQTMLCMKTVLVS